MVRLCVCVCVFTSRRTAGRAHASLGAHTSYAPLCAPIHAHPFPLCSVKPNKLKRPDTFDNPMILAQLLYSGVLETVRIRRQGFPFRETFPEFWRRACRLGYVCIPITTLPQYLSAMAAGEPPRH
ncbi:hypothetical protein EON66_03890 [archaeon]|nr:MAG: hypothetical protein EON66_03890 [archaeon]